MKRNHMILKIFGGGLVLALILGLGGLATGASTTSDPLVTLSYVNGTYRDDLVKEVEGTIGAAQNQVEDTVVQQTALLKKSLEESDLAVSNDYSAKTVAAGGTVTIKAGGEILWLSGAATVGSSGLVNATTGATLAATGAMTANNLYLATGDCVITATGAGSYVIK